jgi:hypothetical protein
VRKRSTRRRPSSHTRGTVRIRPDETNGSDRDPPASRRLYDIMSSSVEAAVVRGVGSVWRPLGGAADSCRVLLSFTARVVLLAILVTALMR